jgi:mediator of RNA polymerase II transcription subunit 14
MLRNSIPSSPVRLPSIYVRLSELLPSKNKSSRTNKQWAKDIVKLTFQGLEPLPTKAKKLQELTPPTPMPQLPNTSVRGTRTNTAVNAQMPLPQGESAQSESAIIITEARMIVPVPAALSILKERVDKDIAFHAKSGAFAFRLLSRVGESVIPSLIERVVRVERLVDFVEVLHRHEKTLKCETVSLGKIVFSYGNVSTADAMDVDGAAPRSYNAIVNLGGSKNTMTLVLERGNPHLRVLDHLTKVLNEGDGLDGVATLLSLTLPTLRALDTMEAAWAPLYAKGELYIFVRAVEWYIVRYNLFPAPSTPDSTSTQFKWPKRIMFEVKMMQRRGEPWWYIRRTDVPDREGDEIDTALKSLWNSTGEGWQGMRVNAVAQPRGVEELLGKLDDILRNVTPSGARAEAPPPAQMQPRGPAPTAPMMQPQRQQQPTPSQSQSQSQGRNPLKREIVEID